MRFFDIFILWLQLLIHSPFKFKFIALIKFTHVTFRSFQHSQSQKQHLHANPTQQTPHQKIQTTPRLLQSKYQNPQHQHWHHLHSRNRWKLLRNWHSFFQRSLKETIKRNQVHKIPPGVRHFQGWWTDQRRGIDIAKSSSLYKETERGHKE